MAIPVLVDTNIWVYALTDDTEKGNRAREVLFAMSEKEFLILAPLQVVKELGRVLLEKKKLDEDEVLTILEDFAGSVRFLTENPQDIMTAVALRKRYKHLDYFDAIIIASALNNGVGLILSEDVPSPDRISFSGKEVQVVNPLSEEFLKLISQI